MINKIISGGQTGADRAALDVAIELRIAHRGWLPKGRKTEDGKLPVKYKLREASSISYPLRTELNVIDSDGTLIISHGELAFGSAYTQDMARKHRRSCLHIDLNEVTEYRAVEIINAWIEVKGIRVLNVSGPRASEDMQIYEATKTVLKSVLYPPPDQIVTPLPKTVEEAVQHLISVLSLREKMNIAGMKQGELSQLDSSLGTYIRDKFVLGSANTHLMDSCKAMSNDHDLDEIEASEIIIQEIWKKLRETHALRVLK